MPSPLEMFEQDRDVPAVPISLFVVEREWDRFVELCYSKKEDQFEKLRQYIHNAVEETTDDRQASPRRSG